MEAFKKACSFQVEGLKYSEKDDRIEYQYEPGSVRQTIKSAGAKLVRSSREWRKKFIFFGPAVERIEETYCAELIPVCLGDKYSEVEIKALYAWVGDFGCLNYSYANPGDMNFNRSLIEKLIGNFYQELRSLPVST